MRDDTTRVFTALVDQPARDARSGLSISYLSHRLDIPPRRVLKIVQMLERAGYVKVRQLDRVQLVTPTQLGYEKAAIVSQEHDRPAPQPAHRWFKLLGASLLALLLASAWWWLDLFPRTGVLQPASSAPLYSPTAPPAETVNSLPVATGDPVPTRTSVPTRNVLPSPTSTDEITPTPAPMEPGPLPTAISIDTPDPNLLPPQPTAVPTPVPLVEQPGEAINILLMGTDTTGGSWRTDTLILVSVDPNLPSVSLLSIPRDLYVYIPGWQMGRINTADAHGERVGYPGGGPGLVKATIEYNLGVRVHYFARADFQGFVRILDVLGGVDVVVDCELHDTFPDPDTARGTSDIDLLPGVHHLDGKQALWYARSRWDTSDFDRGRRQQRVLRGALAQIKQLGLLTKLPELWEDLTQTVQTDLSLDTALWLAEVAGRLDTALAVKSRFIDQTVVRSWRTPDGAAVLLPDYERVGPLIAEALAPPDTARARQGVARVEVLNGTSWPDWAILAADRLLWEGFDVVSIGQADGTDHQQTLIQDLTDTAKGSPVSLLASILRVNEANVVAGDVSEGAPDFRVVVGYDYQPCYKSYWRAVHGSAP
jgi:LCP family protein required for cell wall assembly